MDKKEEFQRYVRAFCRELEPDLGRCLSQDELIGYQQGELEVAEMEKVQSHLVQCAVCRETFKDVSDLFESIREAQPPVGGAQARRPWKTFWRRVQAEEARKAGAPWPTLTGWLFGWRALSALSAALILAVALTGTWALRLQQENQRLAKQGPSKESDQAARLAELEQENRRLEEQAGTMKQNYDWQLAELRRPQLNVPGYDIESQAAIRRSAGEPSLPPISIPPKARTFRLTLIGGDQPEYPSYVIEILDPNGTPVWRLDPVERGSNGNFSITFDRTSLSEGQYHVQLYGQAKGRSTPIADYVLNLRFAH